MILHFGWQIINADASNDLYDLTDASSPFIFLAKDFSHAYILTSLMAVTISLMSLTRSSVTGMAFRRRPNINLDSNI